MSGKLVGWAFDVQLPDRKMKPPERFVLVALADNADRAGICWPSQEELARKTGYTERTIRDHLDTLEAGGLMTREARMKLTGRGRGSDLYRLTGGEEQPENDARPTGKRRHDQPENDADALYREPSTGTSKEPNHGEEVEPTRERLCTLMADLVNERAESQRAKVTETWRREMRLLMERDGRTAEQIEFVIRWVHQDRFEAGVVLGVPKLRERFDSLVVKIKRANGGSGSNGKAAAVSQNVENLRETAAELRRRGQ